MFIVMLTLPFVLRLLLGKALFYHVISCLGCDKRSFGLDVPVVESYGAKRTQIGLVGNLSLLNHCLFISFAFTELPSFTKMSEQMPYLTQL